jgi:hypothetical protein
MLIIAMRSKRLSPSDEPILVRTFSVGDGATSLRIVASRTDSVHN